MTPEQEAGEGVQEGDIEAVTEIVQAITERAEEGGDWDFLVDGSPREYAAPMKQALVALVASGTAPSPHEGEAARCDTCSSDNPRAWYCNGRLVRWFKDTGCPDPFHDPAPTEPRSISEEQLERVREMEDHYARIVSTERALDAAALRDLLAAYEQAEERADENENDAAWQNDRATRAEAERDTAQASEARLREEATRVRGRLRTAYDKGTAEAAWEAHMDALDLLDRALASTPNPEERVYRTKNELREAGILSSKAHAVSHGARWLPPKEDE